jgi:hypothetical protein
MAQALLKKAHRWQQSRSGPWTLCRDCGANQSVVGEDSLCLLARHTDPAINRLMRQRRQACEAADSDSGRSARGWRDSEVISSQLHELDPDGDWYYEGNLYDGHGWVVRRPTSGPTTLTCPGCGRQQVTTDLATFRCPTCGSSSTSTRQNGGSKEATTMATTASTTSTELDLIKAVLEGLKAEGLKVKATWTPKYARLTTAEGTIGYIWKPSRNGIKVKAAATLKELGTGLKKGWKDNSKEGAMASLRWATNEAEVASVVAGLKVAADKLAAKKAEVKS